MIPLFILTEKAVQERYASLPAGLKEILDSEKTSEIIQKICHDHHLIDEERVLTVEQLTAFVILGFVHVEDLASEINAELSLENPKLATSISNDIQVKVFAPLKDLLQKNYQPITPRIVSVVEREPAAPVRPSPSVPPLSQPATLSEIQTKAAPSLSQLSPLPSSSPAAAPPPPSSLRPAPVILHEETVTKPGSTQAGFHLELTPQAFSNVSVPAPLPRPARLEIGESGTPIVERASHAESEKPRVLRYSEVTAPEGPLGGSPPAAVRTPPPSMPPRAPKPVAPLAPSPRPASRVDFPNSASGARLHRPSLWARLSSLFGQGKKEEKGMFPPPPLPSQPVSPPQARPLGAVAPAPAAPPRPLPASPPPPPISRPATQESTRPSFEGLQGKEVVDLASVQKGTLSQSGTLVTPSEPRAIPQPAPVSPPPSPPLRTEIRPAPPAPPPPVSPPPPSVITPPPAPDIPSGEEVIDLSSLQKTKMPPRETPELDGNIVRLK